MARVKMDRRGENNPCFRHGWRKSKLYPVWNGMKQRCTNTNSKRYKDYGGRGITVCEEWKEFKGFLTWALENGYEDGLTLDRIDNSKGYEPSNCRWITMQEQQHNRTNNVYMTCNGETKMLIDWAREKGIDQRLIHARIYRLGWDVERAINTPVRHTKQRSIT